MYGSAHAGIAATAVAVLRLTNPVAGLAVGLASHYVSDAIPHGDSMPGWATPSERSAWRDLSLTVAVIDSCLLIWLWSRRNRRHGHSWPMTMAIVGSLVPDVMQLMERLLGFRFLWGIPSAVHSACHNPLVIILPNWTILIAHLLIAGGLWYWLICRQGPKPPRRRIIPW